MPTTHVWDFVDEFSSALEEQLREDETRYGDTWLERTKEGQEERIFDRIYTYFVQWRKDKENFPIPWLKIVGLSMIAWIRETHPEMWKK